MIKELKKAFEKSPVVYAQVIKKCQIYGGREEYHFLTNRSTHQWSSYPIMPPEYHLNPGGVVAIVGFQTQVGNDKRIVGVTARRADGLEFEIFDKDLKRFIQIVELVC